MKMSRPGIWFGSVMVAVWLLVPARSQAATIVVLVSTTTQLYTAFELADSRPNDFFEIRLSPGFYGLIKNTSSDTGDTSNRTMGSLKLKTGRVKLIGGSNRSLAGDYKIDGGWTTQDNKPAAGFFYVVGNTFEPSLEVSGVTLSNSWPTTSGRSPIQVSKATFRIINSNVVRTQMSGGGGGALTAGGNSTVSIQHTEFNSNGIQMLNPCGGVVNSGGAIALGNVTADISYSTIMNGSACRGGGIYYVAGSSVYSLVIRNSTITGNNAANRGGGVLVGGSGRLSMFFNTIYQNVAGTQNDEHFLETRAGGGIIFPGYSGTLNMSGNIFAQNVVVNPFKDGQPTPDGDDCFVEGAFTSSRTTWSNILGERGNCTFIPTGPLVGTNAVPVNPLLGGKTEGTIFTGGSIIVHFPQPGSIALGRYQNSTIGCQVDDQRRTLRASNFCTIGAIETTE
jgi:hypothetical protein